MNDPIISYGAFLGTLMQSRNQAHIYHLQATSYAKHVALQEYYEGIVDLVDGLAESFQGRHGIIRGYRMTGAIKEDDNPLLYFEGLAKYVETVRTEVPQDSYLQNQIDEVIDLIESVKYKLKYLN